MKYMGKCAEISTLKEGEWLLWVLWDAVSSEYIIGTDDISAVVREIDKRDSNKVVVETFKHLKPKSNSGGLVSVFLGSVWIDLYET